jgi:hypothetical protein
MKQFSKYLRQYKRILFIVFAVIVLFQLCCKKRDDNNPVGADVRLKSPKELRLVYFGETEVRLAWKNENDFRTFPNTTPQFEIERSTNGKNFTLVAKAKADSLQVTFTAQHFTDTVYYFRIRVKAGKKTSGYSNRIHSVLSFPPPAEFEITETSEHYVVLHWNDSNEFEKIFSIEQSTDGTNYTAIDTIGADSTTTVIARTFVV